MTSRNNPKVGLKSTLIKNFLLLMTVFVYIEKVNMTELNLADKAALFAGKLYNQVSLEKPDDNIIISPFSIEACIAMARIGAQGKTAEEIDQILELGTSNATEIAQLFKTQLKGFNNGENVALASRIYVMSGNKIQATFNEILSNNFDSGAEEVNFAQSDEAALNINNWVEARTNHKIKNLIQPQQLNTDTRLVLVNAIHFKDRWEHEFEKDQTNDDKFYLNENDHVIVPIMSTTNLFLYKEIPILDATAIILSYTSGYSMLIILPNSRTGLKNMEEKLNHISWNDILSEMYRTKVLVKIPKFKAEFTIELNEPLQKLGATTMFSDNADFSKMLESSQNLTISKVVHKAYIDVNEEGTEAAASTGIEIVTRMLSVREQLITYFTADKPFLYVIMKERIPLFIGKLLHF